MYLLTKSFSLRSVHRKTMSICLEFQGGNDKGLLQNHRFITKRLKYNRKHSVDLAFRNFSNFLLWWKFFFQFAFEYLDLTADTCKEKEKCLVISVPGFLHSFISFLLNGFHYVDNSTRYWTVSVVYCTNS